MRAWSVRRLSLAVVRETPGVRSNVQRVRENRKSVPADTHHVAAGTHSVGGHLHSVGEHVHSVGGDVHSVGGPRTSRGLGHARRVGSATARGCECVSGARRPASVWPAPRIACASEQRLVGRRARGVALG
jgi:hypothetical protein